MYSHAAHFWLKDDLTEAQRASFLVGLQAIAQSPNVQEVRVGLPVPSERPVVDSSFDYQLFVTFEDKAAHDRYQSSEDIAHETFIQTYKTFWSKLLIYDAIAI